MTDHQKKLLNVKRLLSNLQPEIRTLFVSQHFKNADRTGDDRAAVGSSWKEYWQIFTLEDFPTTCPFCGLPMTEYEIDGCHIKIMGLGLFGRWAKKNISSPGIMGATCNLEKSLMLR